MLTKRIIPCLDVKDGRVVKGVSFVNLRDAGDPVEVATAYDREGADELCFLDITASHENRKTIIDVVERTAAAGLHAAHGRRRRENARRYPGLLNAGADKVSINTAAVETAGICAKKRPSGLVRNASSWRSMPNGRRFATSMGSVHAWRTKADRSRCRSSGRNAMEHYGAGEILLTSMDRRWTAARL